MAGTSGWINWLCLRKGHEVLAPVELEFIKDVFNLSGLRNEFQEYTAAMRIIMNDAIPPEDLSSLPPQTKALLREAIDLYGLIHARYILTQQGQSVMAHKYREGAFGVCPRIMCQKQRVLPIGISDELRQHSCRVYCPQCQEVYLSRAEMSKRGRKNMLAGYAAFNEDHGSSSEEDEDEVDDDNDDSGSFTSTASWMFENLYTNPPKIPIDGAFFGTTFPHMLLMTYPKLVCGTIPIPHLPQLYGFRQYGVKSVILQKIDNGEFGEHARLEMGTTTDPRYKREPPSQNVV